MLSRFYVDTLTTKFIKYLVANTPLPIVKTWKPNTYVLENQIYVTPTQVIRARKTGSFTALDSENFEFLYKYSFGKSYGGLTSAYTSNIKGYDSKTHAILGNYLRAIRDLKDIDLMHLYNCVNNEYLKGVSFNDRGQVIFKESTTYNTLVIPITFDQIYTIGLSSAIPVQYGFIFYNDIGYLREPTLYLNSILEGILTGNEQASLVNENGEVSKDVVLYSTPNCNIRKPFTIISPSVKVMHVYKPNTKVTMYDKFTTFLQNEKYLKLIIRIPKNIKTSVVVLEGDYKKSCDFVFSGPDSATNLPKPEIIKGNLIGKQVTSGKLEDVVEFTDKNSYLTNVSFPSLLQLNDGIIYAFNDKLISYLLLNVITPKDTIANNIARVQLYANSEENIKENNTKPYEINTPLGVWSDTLKDYLFNLAMDSDYVFNKLDINGYVDKEIEKLITRGQIPKWQDSLVRKKNGEN